MDSTTKNVFQLGIAFFFVFTAFNAQAYIEESVLSEQFAKGIMPKHSGYTSLSILYASYTICCFFAPVLVRSFGVRTSLAFGSSAYVLFLLSFLRVHPLFLYLTSALLGLGAALAWTAQGSYLARNSTPETARKQSALFLACFQASFACASLFLLTVFLSFPSSSPSSSNSFNNTPSNSSNIRVAIPPNSNSNHIRVDTNLFADSTIYILYSSLAGAAALGAILLALLPTKLEKGLENKESPLERMKAIFTLASSPCMVALAIPFSYTGLLLIFWSTIFTTAILNTLTIGDTIDTKLLTAIIGIVLGTGQPLLSAVLRLPKVEKFMGPQKLLFAGLCANLFAFSLIFLYLPDESPQRKTERLAILGGKSGFGIAMLFVASLLISLGDACWNTQLFSFLVKNFAEQSSVAFALRKFYQSLCSSMVYFFAGHLALSAHLFILTTLAIFGFFAFIFVEKYLITQKSKNLVYSVNTNS